jgi:hypothetical protein
MMFNKWFFLSEHKKGPIDFSSLSCVIGAAVFNIWFSE